MTFIEIAGVQHNGDAAKYKEHSTHSIPATTTGPYYTREWHVHEALKLLHEQVVEYVKRPDFDVEIGSPRDEVAMFIIEVAEEVVWTGEHVNALDLAMEDLSLVQQCPEAFEADANDDDPPSAEYLILTNFEAWLRQQLQVYVHNHPPCCEICGRESAVKFWFPYADTTAGGPEHLVGQNRWGIGEACQAVLERGEPLRFIEHDQARTSDCACLIPLEQEQPGPVQVVVGTVPPDYPALAQQLTDLEAFFDGWLDEMVTTEDAPVPEPQKVDHAIVALTLPRLPNRYLDPLHLVWLVRQEPALATWKPQHYGMLVEASYGEVTATLLLWCALADHVFSRLRQRWHQRHGRRGQ